jgi:hypothetical protein
MISDKYLGRWKKWIMSVNMGLSLINSKPLLDKWIECAEEIAKHKSPKFAHPSAKICFVEQRLLPMIAYELGLNWGTFIDPIYNTHLVEMQNGSEWTPNFNEWTPEMLSEFIKIKHVWGLKNYFENENIRSMVINNVLSTFEMYPKEKEKHSDLLEEIKSFLLETSKEE